MTYTLAPAVAAAPPQGVIRDRDGAFVPADSGNVDWQDYQAWLAAGNMPTPAAALAPVVPEAISSRQFFQQIAIQGLITQAEALAYVSMGTLPHVFTDAIASVPTANDAQFNAQMAIIGATSFDRHNPTTLLLGTILGQSASQLDAIWTAGSLLV